MTEGPLPELTWHFEENLKRRGEHDKEGNDQVTRNVEYGSGITVAWDWTTICKINSQTLARPRFR